MNELAETVKQASLNIQCKQEEFASSLAVAIGYAIGMGLPLPAIMPDNRGIYYASNCGGLALSVINTINEDYPVNTDIAKNIAKATWDFRMANVYPAYIGFAGANVLADSRFFPGLFKEQAERVANARNHIDDWVFNELTVRVHRFLNPAEGV